MELNYTAQVLIDLAITLLAAFCLSRIAKRLRLPNVTGYILAGILIGPHCLKLIDAQTVEAMSVSSRMRRWLLSPLAWANSSSGAG